MSRKKRGFLTLRHKEVRDVTAAFLSDVCKDVELGQSLLTLNGEKQIMRTAAKTNYVRLDICGRRFWVSSQKTYFDVRVFDQILEGTQNRL